MKKIIKTLIVSFLVMITAMTTVGTINVSADQIVDANPIYQGTHILTAPEVEDERYILKDGEFLYKVVVPADPTPREKVARDEFALLLKRATGIIASVITDDVIADDVYNPNAKYISIGQTNLLEKAGITIDTGALKTNGARIITKDDNIFLAGGVADGALNAVYDFFQICFDFEWFARNNIYINDTITTLKLRDFDVTDIPDINTHQITYGPMAKSQDSLTEYDKIALSSPNLTDNDLNLDINNKSNRSRYSKPGRSIMFNATGTKTLGGKTSTYGSQHNVLNIFSKDEEGWEQKWWADSNNQLCWTAHGDEASYQRMIDFAARRVESYMQAQDPKKYPEITNMMFGVEDGGQACRCAACEYRLEMDGTRAGASIRFVRQVHDKVREWLDDPANAEYYREEFKIVIFSYGEVKEAPAHKDAKGEWVVNEGIFEDMEEYRDRMFENLVVWKTFNGAAHLDVTTDYDDMQRTMDDYRAWATIFDNIFAWNYAELYLNKTFFQDFLSKWNTNLLDFYYDLGVEHMITELCSSGDAVSRWGDLYYYMLTKLSWDGTQSSTELITRFIKAQFGPAAETMEKLYYAQKMNFQRAVDDYYDKYETHFDIGYKNWTQDQYPYEVIRGFISSIDQAYEDIATLQITDPDMYKVYKDRIDVEGFAHYYEMKSLYNGNEKPYTVEEKELWKNRAIELLRRRTLAQLNVNDFLSW